MLLVWRRVSLSGNGPVTFWNNQLLALFVKGGSTYNVENLNLLNMLLFRLRAHSLTNLVRRADKTKEELP